MSTDSHMRLVVADVECVIRVPLGGRLEDRVSLVSPSLGIRVCLSAESLLVDNELSHDTISKEAEPARHFGSI